ncbi:hypothetical protein BH23GEM9_BH23GEM9_20140 [soil metagenome]
MTQYMKDLLELMETVNEEMERLRTEPEAEQVVVESAGDHFWLERRTTGPAARRETTPEPAAAAG